MTTFVLQFSQALGRQPCTPIATPAVKRQRQTITIIITITITSVAILAQGSCGSWPVDAFGPWLS
eukprot:2445013-Lingulodinium_polyedra.AAC.1